MPRKGGEGDEPVIVVFVSMSESELRCEARRACRSTRSQGSLRSRTDGDADERGQGGRNERSDWQMGEAVHYPGGETLEIVTLMTPALGGANWLKAAYERSTAWPKAPLSRTWTSMQRSR